MNTVTRLARTALISLIGVAATLSAAACHGHRRPHGPPCEKPREPAAEPLPALDGEFAPLVGGRVYDDLRPHTFSRAGVDVDPQLSADGTCLAFASTDQDNFYHVYLKDLNSRSARRRTVGLCNNRYPAIDPTGKRLAFASDRNGNWDIFVMDLELGNTVLQVTRSDQFDEIAPSWSPDGSKLIYCARPVRTRPQENWNMWIVDLGTERQSNLGPGLFPKWSPATDRSHPSCNKIVFQRSRYRGQNWHSIWTVRTDGNELTEVISNPAWSAVNPAWSADGQWLAFTNVPREGFRPLDAREWVGQNIYLVHYDGSGLLRLTDDPATDWLPLFGPGGRVFFVSTRHGGHQNVWSVAPTMVEFRSPAPGEQGETNSAGSGTPPGNEE